jgi:PadR family transcriptional regulator PadR
LSNFLKPVGSYLDYTLYEQYYLSMAIERRTHTLMAVLSVFLDHADEELFGFDLARKAGIRPATVYPILVRLEAEGHVTGHWEPIEVAAAAKRRPRKYFKLKRNAVQWAESELARWQRELRLGAEAAPRVTGAFAWITGTMTRIAGGLA